ncbi:hypothetical protein ACFE04_028003 [Oxalis oulophora]
MREWKIQLVEKDGDVWLQRGWVEFTKLYSLAFGHLIVCQFEGNVNFQHELKKVNSPCLCGRSGTRLKTNAASRCGEILFELGFETKLCFRRIDGAIQDLKRPTERGDRDATRMTNNSKANKNDQTFERPTSENPSFSVIMQPLNIRKRSTFDVSS